MSTLTILLKKKPGELVNSIVEVLSLKWPRKKRIRLFSAYLKADTKIGTCLTLVVTVIMIHS